MDNNNPKPEIEKILRTCLENLRELVKTACGQVCVAAEWAQVSGRQSYYKRAADMSCRVGRAANSVAEAHMWQLIVL